MSMIQLKSQEGTTFNAYFAAGPSPAAPGIVLIQEIFGVNAAMRAAADQWAKLGFNVLCPDLFWRQQPGIELDPTSETEFARAFELMQGMDQDLAVADLDTARAWLAQQSGTQNVAGLGYCLGGRLAVLMAMHSPVKCAVSYYGVGLEELVPALSDKVAPMLLHVAGLDRFVPAEARATIMAAAADKPACTAYLYDNVDHAFSRPEGEHYDAAAATLAEERSVAFMLSHFG